MLKKTISYVDYDDNERTEDFYFNLTKAELLEMEFSAEGGMDKLVKSIISEQDRGRLMDLFKIIVHKSYGKKSLDGRRFMKSPEILEEFVQTEAYDELFFELVSDAEYASEFARGILPKIINTPAAQRALPDIDKEKS